MSYEWDLKVQNTNSYVGKPSSPLLLLVHGSEDQFSALPPQTQASAHQEVVSPPTHISAEGVSVINIYGFLELAVDASQPRLTFVPVSVV